MLKPADGIGAPAPVVESAYGTSVADWSRDGRYAIFHGATGKQTKADLSYIELDAGSGPFKPKVFLSTPASESAPKFSPDGRFVAYVSDESGHAEIYIRPFPQGNGRWQVSVNGGTQPRWRSDGKELFYVENDTRMMAVPVSGEGALTLGSPQRLFDSTDLNFRSFSWPEYDVSADGQRFLTSTPAGGEAAAPPGIHVVENWFEEFRKER